MISIEGREGANRVELGQAEAEHERRRAFDRLTGGRLERAYRLAGIVLGDAGEAQDAVHDAALVAWRRWGDLRDPSRFDAWFDRILVNGCRDRLRRRRSSPVLLIEPPEVAGADPFAGSAERDALDRALASLPADQRIALALRYDDDLTVREIAARTSAREGTVKSRLHHAVRALRAAYEAAERNPGGSR